MVPHAETAMPPQPPILPLIDWRQLYAAGLRWSDWLATAQQVEQRAQLESAYERFLPVQETVSQLSQLRKHVHIVVFAEAWAGDVRRHVPVLQRLAEACGRVEVRYITRRQNLEVFSRFLTLGGEALPKAVFLSADFVETGTWGPMPEECRRLIAQGKAANDIPGARILIRARYADDPDNRTAENVIRDQLAIAATERVGAAPTVPTT